MTRDTDSPDPVNDFISLVVAATVAFVIWIVAGSATESVTISAEKQQEMREAMSAVNELAPVVVGFVVGFIVITTVGPPLCRLIIKKAKSVGGWRREIRDYPIRTFDLSRPYVDREPTDAVDCLTCPHTDEPGYQAQYGRELVFAGHVPIRIHEGTTTECLNCRVYGPLEVNLRAEQGEPPSITDKLDVSPSEAHEAVAELEGVPAT